MTATGSQTRLQQLKDHYDLVVVGGGIQGAAMAWEAVSRGLSVALLEQQDYASGTSANSLKTIHGGIRYLQNFDLPRLRQSVRERRVLLGIVPHLVRPLSCVMPTYPQFTKSRLAMWLGTALYNLLSLDRNQGLHAGQQLAASGVISLPALNNAVGHGLQDDSITGGAAWDDAQAWDTERVVLSFILSAQQAGAGCLNYARVEKLNTAAGQVQGVRVKDQLTGESVEVSASLVVDCSGPWQQSVSHGFAQAWNLVIDRRLCDCAVGFKVAAGEGGKSRLLFMAPWREGTLLGTWYQAHKGFPESMVVDQSQVEAALGEVNRTFPDWQLGLTDVVNIHQGLLPADPLKLANGEPKLLSDYSVRPGAASGHYCVQAVKYTTARFVAEKALNRMARESGLKINASVSERHSLYGGEIKDLAALRADKLTQYAGRFARSVIERLVDNYGSCVDDVMACIGRDASLAASIPGAEQVLAGELLYLIENEQVMTLSDLLLRRTGLGSFKLPSPATVDFCANFMAEQLGWDELSKQNNIEAFYASYPQWLRP
jgi:glycerol-3-phosphate dehydrogenase